eukprot:CAMPEP_0119304116 /NCGR_PEP_ID=MMETSP1333-20130426/5417_1 /TAXON_ID=418940 /ORGANISM="Scyphosphaera apsteinii, Strain RCC1455" /LENGTH=486 /DNA_ID=CAMNT_0007306937 /DNA_START=51 /DNA_END=1511 /DNA_ORIENTATION=+
MPPRRRSASGAQNKRLDWLEAEDSYLIAADRRRHGRLPHSTGPGSDSPHDHHSVTRGYHSSKYWTFEVGSGGGRARAASFFSSKSFAEVGATQELQDALRSCGARRPSHIQAMSYDVLLNGKDALVADQTGSGKTLAYLAPIIQTLRRIESTEGRAACDDVRALVIVPTSELAQQVLRVAKALSAAGVPFRSAIVTGDHSWSTQKKCAAKGLELLIGTAGRLHAHLIAEPPSFNLQALRFVVLDEVDVLYSDGDFQDIWFDLRQVIPSRAAHAFVTATLPPAIEQEIKSDFPLIKKVHGPNLHTTRSGLRQKLIDCSAGSTANIDASFDIKLNAMLAELQDEPVSQTLVFCNTISSCRRVENALCRRDRRKSRYEVQCFHGAIPADTRKKVLASFSEPLSSLASPRLLVCTDRASRGMDFPQVQHVVLFDFPRDGVEYVRRVGRATRGGNKPGRITALVLGRQLPYAKALMRGDETGETINLEIHS